MSTKQTEDIMFSITMELEENGLRRKFDAQLKKMATQDKWKWEDVGTRWEYALQKVKNKHAKSKKRTARKDKRNSKG